MATRAEAQARIDQIRGFQQEIQQLRAEGQWQFTAEQLQGIQAHHAALVLSLQQRFDVDADSRTKQLSLGMRAASFLGALSLAASVFLLFYKIWGLFNTVEQLALLLAAPAATLGLTVWLRTKDSTGYFVKLAALVCFACFVLDLSMLGHIFNITPSDKALLAWAALGILLAYTTDARLLLVAGLVCAVGFITARIGPSFELDWLDFMRRPERFFPAAVASLLLPAVVNQRAYDGFAGAYRVIGLLSFYPPVLILSFSGESSYLPFDPKLIGDGYQIVGFTAAAAAAAWGIRRAHPEVMNTSIGFFVMLLLAKFYDWWWEIMPRYLFFLVIGLTALLFLFVLRRLRSASPPSAAGAP